MYADPPDKKHIESITLLLQQVKAGQHESEERLISLIYEDLKLIARRQRKKIHSNTINTTGLVHEAWLKLQQNGLEFNNKNHFMAVATIAIKHFLLNEVKRNQSLKNKHKSHVTFSSQVQDQFQEKNSNNEWLLELDDALEKVHDYQPRLAQVFQMRFFSGYTEKEIAEFLQISERTVHRDWLKAKMMLSVNLG